MTIPLVRPKALVAVALCIALTIVYLSLSLYGAVPKVFNNLPKPHWTYDAPQDLRNWTYIPERDQRDLGFTEEQCEVAFPGQDAEIKRAMEWHRSQGGINEDQIALWREEPDKAHGQLRVLIYDGDIYIVGEKQGVVDRTRYLAGLSMIYRSMIAIPDPRVLPNIEFTLDRMDHPNPEPQRPRRTVWAWTRHVSDNNTWVMPDFNGWATSGWDAVGGYRAFRERSEPYLTPFKSKIKKVLWRGQLDVGQKISQVRKTLLDVTRGKPWSDCGELHWDSREGVIPMEEHCKWQFLVHTEGNSWSGRLRSLMNCNSVTIIHNPLEYIAHFYPMLIPSGPKQNYVAAKNDWSDLEEKLVYYFSHQDEADAIATEAMHTFRDRYLSPAAEACYIRRMIYEYAKVQNFKPQLMKKFKKEDGSMEERPRGMSWERFAFRPPKNRFDVPPFPEGYWFKSDMVDFED